MNALSKQETRPRLSTSIDNLFKTFIHRNGLNFSSRIFNVVGGALTVLGISFISCSKKLQSRTFVVVLGGIFITVLGMTSLHAGRQIAKIQGYVRADQNTIQQYEQSGDYATALKMARYAYADSQRMGLTREAARFSESVNKLENELLTLGSSRLLFDENHQPRVKLLKLLELAGMDPLNQSEKAVLQINGWAQKNLLRQGERWEEQTGKFEALKPKIKPLLSELGFIEASSPHFDKYQGALVHGATLSKVRLRLHYLVEQWKQGVRFPHVYFLSGARPLDPQQESADLLMQDKDSPLIIRRGWTMPEQLPKTECEMMQFVWDQSEIPETMRREVQTHFINAPMKKDPKSEKLLRPNTDDTVVYWLKENPSPGRYLAVTNAPYTNRQDLVVRALAPKNYGLETIGPGVNEQETVAILLDELARCIFQIKQLSEIGKG